ncbi:MAG: metal ABC transporter substrate-binding protein [Treponema sp.]|nr:metal ABC transporter substrate-binding protein [Treponema sp.]
MKRLLFFFCAALLLSSAAFARPRQDRGNKNAVSVVTTVFPSYDFVREIAGDTVNLSLLLPPGAESHSFEPTPRDIIQIQNSDLFIYVGGESETWVERILDSVDSYKNGKLKVISLMDMVEVVEEEIVEGMEEEEEEAGGEEEAEYDEHVWTSPRNAGLIVHAISEALCQADSANAAFYRRNAQDYQAKLDELDGAFQTVVNGARRKTIIFGDRFPFRYFADDYGLSYYAAFPGCSTETECSAATVAFLVDKVKNENIPVIFHIELSNEKIADTISEATGAKKLLLHACHNVSKQDMDRKVSYLELQRGNVDRLREALR